MSWEDLLPILQSGGAGLSILLGYLFYDERKEHKLTRKSLEALLEVAKQDAASMTRETVSAVRDVSAAINKVGDAQEETRASMARIAEAVTILSVRGRNRGA
jgi:hypothetical protein